MAKQFRKASKREASDSKFKDLNRREMDPLFKAQAMKFNGGPNSPEWYSKSPELLRDSASLSFFEPLGSTIPFASRFTSSKRAAGIQILRYVPIMGSDASGSAHAANIAALNTYAWVRHANSGSRNYEPADYFMYQLCVTSAYAYVSHLMRLYSLVMTYKLHNWYFAKPIITALGYDFKSIHDNIPQLRTTINRAISQLGAFAVPNNWTVTKRQCWMNLNIFADRPIKKSALYLYAPDAIHIYDWANKKVKISDFIGVGGITFEEITDFVDNLLTGLLRIEDVGIMSGDTMKAFAESGLLSFDLIPENFHVEVSYEPEVLNQIHNTTVIPLGADDLDTDKQKWDIVQVNGQLQYNGSNGRLTFTGVYFGDAAYRDDVLDLIDDDTSPERVMVATRNMCFFSILEHTEGAQVALYDIEGAGTELFTTSTIYTISNAAGDLDSKEYKVIEYDTAVNLLEKVTVLSQFAYHPRSYMINSTNQKVTYVYDINNYTKIGSGDLSRMSEAAVISEFSIPLAGLQPR